jgi:predicted short-subunit dehydrogenase-like oxidoreductase (DUF2520 family)
MKKSARMSVAIVGAGKVGSVLGKILVENGDRITAVVSRTQASARAAGRFLGCINVSTSLDAIPRETDIVYLTAPHAAIGHLARTLAELKHLDFKRLNVCHASGMLTAAALKPLTDKGATVFSFHPLQTFPRDFALAAIVPTVRGIYYGVDGTPRAVRAARRFAKALNGRVLEVPIEMRPFYHATCVVASNHLTTLLSIVQQMFYILGNRKADYLKAFMPIVAATLRNVEATSPERALSGPIARGGIETVREHLQQVQHVAPDLIPYFSRMTIETARLARKKGSIDQKRFDEICSLAAQFDS